MGRPDYCIVVFIFSSRSFSSARPAEQKREHQRIYSVLVRVHTYSQMYTRTHSSVPHFIKMSVK